MVMIGETIHEYDGLQVIPPLTRTAAGWVQQSPTPCPECGGTTHLVGWHACMCRDDTLAPGHRTWICRNCDHRRLLGCRDETAGAVL